MTYQVLARKWRPNTFAQVVGQSHVITALTNALNNNRLHHAYLLSGTRGVGKTSIARLFAKGLNCEQGVTATPCGKCNNCLDIESGRFGDLIEIDAASRTKVEDTRDLLDNVQYKPSRGRYKVYIIDEVHMLSRHSFNALLKTLEEPPEYVKFILATTDPQKLPITVLSRCLQFHLKHLEVEQIIKQLENIFTQENIEYELNALSMLANSAQGSLRDALSLADQALALGDGVVVASHVANMLGILDNSHSFHLLIPLLQGDVEACLEQVSELARMGTDWALLLKELAINLHKLAILKMAPKMKLSGVSAADKITLRNLIDNITSEDIQLGYQILIKGRQDLPLAPNERVGIEMTLMRFLAFKPVVACELNPQKLTSRITQKKTVKKTNLNQSIKSSLNPDLDVAHAKSVTKVTQQVVKPLTNLSVDEKNLEKTKRLLSAREELHQQILKEQKLEEQSQAKKFQTTQNSSVSKRGKLVIDNFNNVAEQTEPTEPTEPYRWQPSKGYRELEEKNRFKYDTNLNDFKKTLEHEKAPHMSSVLIDETCNRDRWCKLIQEVSLPKFVQILALNSSCEIDEVDLKKANVKLNLRKEHQHLINNNTLDVLQKKLVEYFAKDISLSIEVSEIGTSPIELREKIYQEKVIKAVECIKSDRNIIKIKELFLAQIDFTTIQPI